MTPRGLLRALSALVLLAGAGLGPATAIAAPVPVDFGAGSAAVEFGEQVTFEQPVELASTPVRRIELLVSLEGDPGARVQEVQAGGSLETGTLQESYDLVEDHIYPNTDVVGQFRVTAEDGSVTLGPEIAFTYLDDRFEWRTLDGQTPAGSTVRVHWYDGDQAFGQRSLEIAIRGVANSEARLGVTEREPIDFWIYSNERDFYGALGPGSRENVGGVALAEIRSLFAQIRPEEIDDSWVETVIPHELAHLVFHTAVDNPYHDPPRWLNEGLAVYDSEGYSALDRVRVSDAIKDGNLIPIVGLAGLFPTTYDEFALAYAESVSAVDYFVRAHGADALVDLIRSYQDGITDDEAFQAAIGKSVAEFDRAWQADLGVTAAPEYGPQPPPPGPLPSGWSRTPDEVTQPGATPGPSATPGGPSQTPGTTAAPSVVPSAGPASTGPSAGASGGAPTPAPTIALSEAPAATAAGPVTTPTSGGGIDAGNLGLLLGAVAFVLATVGVGLILANRRSPARP
jgi:hypothetical protein